MKLLILLFVLPMMIIADTYVVKHVKGDISKNGETVKIGSILNENDLIKINQNSGVLMVSKNGGTIRAYKSGVYSIAKLEAKTNTKKTNVTKQLAASLLNELQDAEDLPASGNLNDNMSSLGAVERALNNKLFFYDNVSTYCIKDSYTFNWNYEGDVDFLIKDADDNILYETTTSENSITVNLKNIDLKSGICYFYSIKQKNNTSDEYCIYRMTNTEHNDFVQKYLMVISDMKLNNSIDYLIIAKFYEQHKLVDGACDSYEKAIELGDDSLYAVLYKKYLISVGLLQKANSLKI